MAKMASRLQNLLEQLPRLTVQDLSASPAFTCFPDLPLELRNKIWMCACLEPRTFTITIKMSHQFGRTVQGSLPNPSILSVNFESREVAKKRYEFCPQTRGYSGAFSQKTCGVYINFDVDRFLVSDRSTFSIGPRLGFFIPRPINAVQSRVNQSQEQIFVADISRKVKFVGSKVFSLGRSFQELLDFILHPGLQEFSIVEDDQLFQGPDGNGNDCVGGYLLFKKRGQQQLTSTKAFIEEIGSKKGVDVSALRIKCKFVASTSGMEFDLAPIEPVNVKFEPFLISQVERVDALSSGTLPRAS